MQTIYVVGSFRDLETSREVAKQLSQTGFVVSMSQPGDPRGIDGCLDRVMQCDLVYVSNPRGEIGKSVSLDIGYALGKGKPGSSARPIEDPPIGHRVEVASAHELAGRVRA